jgi:hypothetical protein
MLRDKDKDNISLPHLSLVKIETPTRNIITALWRGICVVDKNTLSTSFQR